MKPATWYSWNHEAVLHLLSPGSNIAVCGAVAGKITAAPMILEPGAEFCAACMAGRDQVDAPNDASNLPGSWAA